MLGMTRYTQAEFGRYIAAKRAEPGEDILSALITDTDADSERGVGMTQYITEDYEVGGTTLPAGTTAMCSMAAANRDERAFDDAADLKLHRSPNTHLAFGAGAHACLGQPLARTELQVVLDVLLRKLPTLELAVPAKELRRVEGLAVGGLRGLPVRW